MLLTSFMFDSKSPNWENNQGYNQMFLAIQERRINEIIRTRGYIYLNQIYEELGVKWNPDNVNPCVTNHDLPRVPFVDFELFKEPNNSFLVHILTHDIKKEGVS